MSKETYYSVKRDLLQCQKRPTTVSKETYYRLAACTSRSSVRQPRDDISAVRTAEERYYYETRLELARDAAAEDVRGPMTQHGQQLPWPGTC